MSVSPYQHMHPRYVNEVHALKSSCINVISGCQRLIQACDEAEARGGSVTVSNYETTITVGLRALLKTMALVLFMQTLGLKFNAAPVKHRNGYVISP